MANGPLIFVSAFFPAQAAAKQQPVEALHGGNRLERSVNPSIAWLFSGLLCLVAAALFSVLSLTTGPRWLSFAGAFFVLAFHVTAFRADKIAWPWGERSKGDLVLFVRLLDA